MVAGQPPGPARCRPESRPFVHPPRTTAVQWPVRLPMCRLLYRPMRNDGAAVVTRPGGKPIDSRPRMADTLTGFEFAEALASAIDTRDGVWQWIRAFAGSWLSPLTERDGCGEDELAAAERRLGHRLPAAVREAYALFGKRPDMTSNQDRLLSPGDVDLDYTEEALVFRIENQGVAEWGIQLDHVDQPDPAVDIRMSMADWHSESWEAWLPRF